MSIFCRAHFALLTLVAACAAEPAHPVVPMDPRPAAGAVVASQCFAACLVGSLRGDILGPVSECADDCQVGIGIAPACELERATGERQGGCR